MENTLSSTIAKIATTKVVADNITIKLSKKYFFNFPKYNYCISLGYKKSDLLTNVNYFKSLYKIIFKNEGDIYLTKDETVLDLNSKFRNKLKKKIAILSLSSNDFYQKLIG